MGVKWRVNSRWIYTCIPVCVTILLFIHFVAIPALLDRQMHIGTSDISMAYTPRTGHELREVNGVQTEEHNVDNGNVGKYGHFEHSTRCNNTKYVLFDGICKGVCIITFLLTIKIIIVIHSFNRFPKSTLTGGEKSGLPTLWVMFAKSHMWSPQDAATEVSATHKTWMNYPLEMKILKQNKMVKTVSRVLNFKMIMESLQQTKKGYKYRRYTRSWRNKTFMVLFRVSRALWSMNAAVHTSFVFLVV